MSSTQNEDRSFSPISDDHIGVFYECNPKAGPPRTINVYANQELMIGRDANSCQYTFDNAAVSNKHLRIYTVIFDQENPGEIAPLIYAKDMSRYGTRWNGYRIRRQNDGVLLSDGDILKLAPGIELEFRCAKIDPGKPFDVVQLIEMKRFECEYRVTPRKLGAGAYGQVHMAFERKTAQQVACKIIDIRVLRKKNGRSRRSETPIRAADVDMRKEISKIKKWSELQRKKMYTEQKLRVYQREAEILEKVQHPNIISLERVYKTENTLYLFQDLITAGDLFSFLEFKKGKLLDIEAAVIVRQIVIALEYLHDQNIVHRDLKPDNILMSSLSSGARVVLTDFGCARVVGGERKRMSSVMGTLEYTAPEVTRAGNASKRGYTKAVDLWSLGCVTVVLLTGGSPFTDPITKVYSQKLAHECDLKTLSLDEDWIKVGDRPKDFVRGLLILNEEERMTAKQALTHEWFTNESHKEEFEKVYKRAVKDWTPRASKGSIIAEINDIGPMRKRSPRPILSQRKQTPVEFPYKPFPHNMSRILYPRPSPKLDESFASPEKLLQRSKRLTGRRRTKLLERVSSRGKGLQSPVVEICNQEIVWDKKREDVGKVLEPKTTSHESAETRESKMAPPPVKKSEKSKDSTGESESHIRRPFSLEAWNGKIDTSKRPPKFPDLRTERQSEVAGTDSTPAQHIEPPRKVPRKRSNIWDLLNDPEESQAKHEASRQTRQEKVDIPKYPLSTETRSDSAPNNPLKRPCKPTYTPSAKKQKDDIYEFEDDQVYEEVDDGISGSRHVAYGQRRSPGYC